MWLRRHWPKVVGFFVLAGTLGARALGLAGSIDLVVSRTQDPGWVAVVIGYLINAPFWLDLLAIAGGVALIWWDLRRHRKPAEFVGVSPEPAKVAPQRAVLTERVRGHLEDQEARSRIELIDRVNDLASSLLSREFDEETAIPEVNDIYRRFLSIDPDIPLALASSRFSEAVSLMSEARRYLRKNSSLTVLGMDGVTNDAVLLLSGWREALVYGLRGGEDPHLKGHNQTKHVEFQMGLLNRMDFQAKQQAVWKEYGIDKMFKGLSTPSTDGDGGSI